MMRKRTSRIVAHVFLIVIVLAYLVPVWLMTVTSLRSSEGGVFRDWQPFKIQALVPCQVDLTAYQQILADGATFPHGARQHAHRVRDRARRRHGDQPSGRVHVRLLPVPRPPLAVRGVPRHLHGAVPGDRDPAAVDDAGAAPRRHAGGGHPAHCGERVPDLHVPGSTTSGSRATCARQR